MISFELTKILSLLVYPLSQSLVILLLALLARLFGGTRSVTILLLVAIGWLYTCSTAYVADALMASLESEYPARTVSKVDKAEAIVVLGGATNGTTHGNRLADMNGQGDRLLHAVELYKARKAPLIILSGGSRSWEAPESVLMAEILQLMGIPEEAIIEERVSRNTLQNARYTNEVLAKNGIKRVILVTSAFHMRRAETMFRLQGIEIVPSATDYQVVHAPPVVAKWLPRVEDLQRTTYALREYIGFWVYWAGV
ncbi:MAG: YdcF family protein [Halieaceae bacterium]